MKPTWILKCFSGDDNKTRREAVRRKTAQYLMKAEDLYNQYLSAEVTNNKRWVSEHPRIDVDPRSAHLRGAEEELKNYKVLGLIDSVLLVLDSVSYQTFIIKVSLGVVPWHKLCFSKLPEICLCC